MVRGVHRKVDSFLYKPHPRPLPRREGSKETHPGPTDPPQPSLLREGEKDGGKFGGNEINLYLCNE